MASASRCRALFRVLLLAVALAALLVGVVHDGFYLEGEPALYHLHEANGTADGNSTGDDWRPTYFFYTVAATAGLQLVVLVLAIVQCVVGSRSICIAGPLGATWALSQIAWAGVVAGQYVFYYTTFDHLERYRAWADLSPWTGLVAVSGVVQIVAVQCVSIALERLEYRTIY